MSRRILRNASSAMVLSVILAGTANCQAAPPRAAANPEMTLYRNGRIYTNDPTDPWAVAMLVRGEEFIAVGDEDEMGALAEKGTKVVDLEKHFVMPGFNDAHVHLGGAGKDWLAVRLFGAANIRELQKRVAAAVSEHKEGEWITGSGWDHTLWPEKRFPNRQQLDEVSPKSPVLLTHVSGHVAVANSLALHLAGITRDSANPSGGEIEKDGSGEPTGMLKEGAAMRLVEGKIPARTAEQRRRGIELALADAAKNGVTSVQDNSAWEDFLTYRALKNDGKLTVRVTEWLPFAAPLEKLEQLRRDGGTTDPWLRT